MNSKIKALSPKRTFTWMHTAIVVILLATLMSACNLVSVYGSGDILTRSLDVHNFTRVNFSGEGKFMLSQGDEETVAIAADDNLIKHINVEVRDGTLYIWHRERISPSQPLQIRVSVKKITGLDLAGIIDAEVESISTDNLKVDLSGLVTLKMNELEAEKLIVKLSGSSELELTGTGEVTEQEVSMNGTNSYHSPKLQSQKSILSLSGSNNVIIWAVDTMNVSIAGDGSVQYHGNPQINQSGSGNVKLVSLGDK